ncbi:hypothetical protein DPMN_134866 [Dreissena polymorpha]|uniref:Uncharacterized protein n=1 Tax=Dreissena polymorpha TaxID=45954 RepID=A0A9D4FWZ6_DREPO|nr:hypothetical protein DPMN_134866 [Dreissena polymorpha]
MGRDSNLSAMAPPFNGRADESYEDRNQNRWVPYDQQCNQGQIQCRWNQMPCGLGQYQRHGYRTANHVKISPFIGKEDWQV